MFEKLGRFDIKGLLGRGAMGEVFLGVDPALGREVAIKTILAAEAEGEAKERFAREARAAGVLNHPNIVTIYEFGEDQGVLFIAMERVRGHDLEELLRQRSLSPGEALEVLAQVCDGLEFAHRNQIIHRDVKPSNVRVLRDGRRIQAKVMDFGVARLRDSEMTATGTVVGTVSYMAPEYIRTGKPDGRSDLFAVGVMLYECITGRRPFEGDTTPTILYKIVNEPPDPVDISHLHEISSAIRGVLDKALAKDPDKRFQTAEELALALRASKDPSWQGQIRGDATIRLPAKTLPEIRRPEAPPTAKSVPVSGKTPSSRALVAAGLVVAGIGVALAGGALAYRWLRSRPRETAAGIVPLAVPSLGDLEPSDPPSLPSDPTPFVEPKVAAEPRPAPPSAPTFRAEPLPPAPSPRPELPPPVVTDTVEPSQTPDRPLPSQQKNFANVSLSEAISLVDTDPDQAIAGLRKVIAIDPGNANAYAWLVVALYGQGRYSEIPGALARARRNGIPRARLMDNIRFRMVVQNDSQHRIPGGNE